MGPLSRGCVVAISALTLPVLAGPAEDDKAAADVKKLQGDWVCVREEFGGKAISKAELKERNKRLAVKGKKFTMKRVQSGKLGAYDGRFELDAAAQPKKFDWTGKGPAGAAIEMEGIYELTDERFKLCYLVAGEGKKRPTEFKTAPKTGHVLLEFKRDKDE